MESAPSDSASRQMSLKAWFPVLSIFVLLIVALSFTMSTHPEWFGLGQKGFTRVTVGNVSVMVTVADSDASRELGLSGRPNLPEDEGLLFVFGNAAKYGFWMKDMLFPIDILWFDENKTLIHVSSNLSPNTYPQVFEPPAPVLYVLEVPAGFAEQKEIKIGDPLSF